MVLVCAISKILLQIFIKFKTFLVQFYFLQKSVLQTDDQHRSKIVLSIRSYDEHNKTKSKQFVLRRVAAKMCYHRVNSNNGIIVIFFGFREEHFKGTMRF